MRSCAINLTLTLVVCFIKASELASVSIESECISNPTLNPKLCIKRISDIMKRLQNVGPEVRLNQRGRDLMAGARLYRKNAVMLQDVPLSDEDVDPETKKLINKLQAGISIKNEVSGDNVNFNQDLAQINQLVKRIAVSNKLSGNIVNTKQNIKEVNLKKRKFYQLEEALEDVAKALENVASSKQNNDENVQQAAKALQRLAVQNNIKGNKVNTKQDVEEYNDELVAATAFAVMKIAGDKPTKKVNAEELNDIAQALRRIAIKNDINGVTVNTKQDISEYNDEVVKTIVMALRRLAVKNEISGETVNTDMKLREINDNPVQAISDALQRLAVSNKITGKVVNTEQDIAEVNNDDPQSFTSQSDAKVLKKIYKPFEKFVVKENQASKDSQTEDSLHKKVASPPFFEGSKSDEVSKLAEDELFQAQQDFFGNGQGGVYLVKAPDSNIIGSARNIRVYEDQLRAQRFDLLKRLQPSLFMDESSVSGDDELEQGDESDDDDDVDDDNSENEDDDEQENLSQAQQDEKEQASLRRMTINNNASQQTRRLMVDNNIHGKKVNTALNATEHNKGPTKVKEPATSTKATAKAVINQPVEKKPQKMGKKIICKAKKGKKVSKADLKKFVALLEKLRGSKSMSDIEIAE